MTKFTVIGNVFLACGFDITVKADTSDEARALVKQKLTDIDPESFISIYGASVNEICIYQVEKE